MRNWRIGLATTAIGIAGLGSAGCLPVEFVHNLIQASQPQTEDPWDELIDDIADIIHDELENE